MSLGRHRGPLWRLRLGERTAPPRQEGPPHLPSAALLHAAKFAIMAAEERRSDTLDPRDGLGGIYVASLEFTRLKGYWREPYALEALAAEECGGLRPRLSYWLDSWWADRTPIRRRGGVSAPLPSKKISGELNKIAIAALELADRGGSRDECGSLRLGVATFLLAAARLPGSAFAASLLRSGLDLDRIEAALRDPKALL